jgi:diguanylate cyclase (GGDEF)-like protein/PAS domain S-box-containing protein
MACIDRFMTFKRSADSDTSILELAVRDAVDAFWYWNFEEKAGWVSDRWYELTGVPKGDGTPSIDVWSEIVDQEDLPRVQKALIAHLKHRQPYDVEFRLVRSNETRIWVRARAQATWDEGGRATRFAGSMVDIDALKQAQNASQLIAERFHGLCEASSDGILIVDQHSLILYSNPAVERIFGRARNEMFGRNLEMLQPEHLRAAHTRGMSLYMQTGVRKLNWDSVETSGLRADGCEFPIEITFAELQTPGSRNFVAFVRDITRRREAEQRIKYLALHDSLTGLLNRNSIEEKTAEAIGAAERDGSLVAVLYIDLDRFKPINDWLGHAAGDELLMQVAERILAALPSVAFVGRQGGDEFIVVLPAQRIEEAAEAASALLEGLKADFDIGEQTVQVGASVGISVYPHDGTFPQELLAYADEAMYFAKAAGRNRFKLYSAEMSEKAAHRLHIEHELRSAIERRELSIVYQPLFALANNRVVGAEALLRWNHPELGLVEPVDFIPVAESSGLIIPLGEWVLIEACAQLARWRKAGMTELTVAVNVSARQLLQPNLLTLISAALASASLPGSALILEITESSLIEHPDEVAGVLRALAELGVASSIDDFGTGFSSLSYLKRFPLAQIKIDRSFIQDITTDRNDAAIVNAVIAMGRSLGLTVIAEGVETEAQALYLRGQGCHHVQGYWFSRPLTVGEFTKQLIG